MYDPRFGPCNGCTDRFPPYQGEDGKMHTCRQGCAKWEAHEAGKKAYHEAQVLRIAGSIGISPGYAANLRRVVKDQKSGRGRAR